MKYDRTKTTNHSLATQYPCCIEDFNIVVKNEDDLLNKKQYICVFISNIEVLNLDCTEKQRCLPTNIPRNKTTDISFAISDNDKTEMLLVEFKLNVVGKNINGIKKVDLEEKVKGAILLLGNSIPIHHRYVFVFQSNKKEQVKNRMQRMNPKIPNNYVVMDLQELITTYF